MLHAVDWIAKLFRPRIVDDRGQRWRVFDFVSTSTIDRADPVFEELALRIRDRLACTFLRGWQVAVVVVSLVLTAFIAAMALGQTAANGYSPWTFLVAIPVGLALAAVTQSIARTKREHIVRTLLREGRCAACAVLLSENAVDDDGCVACHLCGAAWRDERVGVPLALGPTGVRAGELGPTVEDENGYIVRVVDPTELGRGAVEGVDRERAARVARKIRGKTAFARVIGLASLVLALSLPFTCLGYGIVHRSHAVPFMALIAAAVGAVVITKRRWFAMWWNARAQTFAEISRRSFIEHDLCPACGGDLTSSSEDTLECAQCGCAWRSLARREND